ncbi:MAG TPA: hypothetical protein VK993_04915, partial [Chthoniobacterales bacterium]|nr:hypothetical protein [Chthoniobacterales bacterium]
AQDECWAGAGPTIGCVRIAGTSRTGYNAGMRAATLCIVLALLAFARRAFADPKAYDVVKYRGKADGLTIAFGSADGYPEASEVRTKQRRSGESTRFVLAAGGEMRFVPEKNRAGYEEVTLEMSPDDGPAEKVLGAYRAGGKTIPFRLTKQEE